MELRICGSPLLRKRRSLLGVLPLLFVLLFLIVGALLLNDEVRSSDVSQSAKVITGAAFLSLALISMFIAPKRRWKNRKSDVEELRKHLE